MARVFVSLYRYFERHKALMYVLMITSATVFLFFGAQVRYEENISALVPTGSDAEAELVFGDIKVKDKVFLQFTSRDSLLDVGTLTGYVDAFMEAFEEADSATRLIDNTLYRIDGDLFMGALSYVLDHVPSFVPEDAYGTFDRQMTPRAAGQQMSDNLELLLSDETGTASMMVAMDPFALRNAVLGGLEGTLTGGSGFTVMDGHLVAQDSTVAYAFIAPSFTYEDSFLSTKLIRRLRRDIKAFHAGHPDVEILVHGLPVRSVGNSGTIKTDMYITLGISLLVILLFILLCFKDWRVIPHQLLPVAYGTVFALACIRWIKGTMSFMALGIGAVVLGVAISYCLHIITHHKYVGDPEQVLRDEATPVILGCLTTIGAFLGLLFTSSALLKDFGIFASFALAGSTFFALVLLPHFLGRGRTAKNERAFRIIDRIDAVQLDRNPLVMGLVAVVTVVCLIFAPRVRFDSDLNHIGYISPEEVRAEALYNEKNSEGFSTKYFAATSDDLSAALRTTRGIVSVLDSLQRDSLVHGVGAPVSTLFLPEDEQAVRIDAWYAYWTPYKVSQARKTLSAAAYRKGISPEIFDPFFGMIEAEYVPGDLYASGVIPDNILCNFIERSDDGRYMVFTTAQVREEDNAAVAEAVSRVPHALVIDSMFYTNNMVRIVHDDFNVALGISSLFVFIVLLLSFRNLWLAIIAFLPMGLSWYVVEGIMAMAGLPFNLLNIVISTFIFGIGVDYSIFVMQGLLTRARTGRDDLLLWHKAAIFFSAVVLIVVVGSLLFARHPALVSVGASTIIGMVATILYTYTLEPFLFRVLVKIPFFRRSFRVE